MYQQARPWAVAIKEEVLTRRMPKWNAARGFGAFANDPSLAPFEIALIAAWVDGGAPENEKNKVTAAPATPTITPSVFTPPPDSRVRTVSASCDEQPAAGKLLAIRPMLDKTASAGIAVLLPNGRQEILAWIRDFDPVYATTIGFGTHSFFRVEAGFASKHPAPARCNSRSLADPLRPHDANHERHGGDDSPTLKLQRLYRPAAGMSGWNVMTGPRVAGSSG